MDVTLKYISEGIPRGPLVRTWSSQCQGPGSIPSWGTKLPQVMKHGQKQKNMLVKEESQRIHRV